MNNHRLGYQRLAEALVERGLVESQAAQSALAAEESGGPLFPDALIEANLVSDWELSHVVCQLHGLPFLNVDMAEPDPEAQEGLDLDFLWENGIVPLARHGQIVTLCMPAIVPAETLGFIAASSDLLVLVVVGTVVSNRRWILSNAKKPNEPEVELGVPTLESADAEENSGWGNLFDEADAAVLQDLDSIEQLEITEPEMDLSCLDDPVASDLEPEGGSPVPLPPPLPRQSAEGGETIL